MAKILLQPGVYAEMTERGAITIAQAFEGPLGQTRHRTIELSQGGAQALLDFLCTGQGELYPIEEDVQPE